jgi:hypothetical protein
MGRAGRGALAMTFKKIEISEGDVALAKRLFEQKTPDADIARAIRVSVGTFRNRLREWGWQRPRAAPSRRAKPPAPKVTLPIEQIFPPVSAKNLTHAERVQYLIDLEFNAVGDVLRKLGTAPDEAKPAAQALAIVRRSLAEMLKLNTPQASTEPTDDDDMPENLDEQRRELARRIEALVAEQTREADGESGSPADPGVL